MRLFNTDPPSEAARIAPTLVVLVLALIFLHNPGCEANPSPPVSGQNPPHQAVGDYEKLDALPTVETPEGVRYKVVTIEGRRYMAFRTTHAFYSYAPLE